mmetsp:Transcript_61/g.89  ORF Transcript_61/g.89 Transcript_61/m.89 type:complete len:141 (-) Transcript_61:3895-4317(-)
MSLFQQTGRIVVLLKGKYAGRKAIIYDKLNSKKDKKNPDKVYLFGIKNYPKRIIRKMNFERKIRKSNVKIFFRKVNSRHVFLTRYIFDGIDSLNALFEQNLISISKNLKFDSAKKKLFNNVFTDIFLSGRNKWFFKKLKF